MIKELEDYIELVHREPYHILKNNCIHKTVKIFRKCKELNYPAKFVLCFSKTPPIWRFMGKRKLIPLMLPHCYLIIDGGRVDVSLSPEQEEELFPNGDIKVYLPIVIARC